MILVDDAGGVLPAINHSPWNGLTLADVVMPFFLFIVGVSLGLTYKVSAIGKFIVFMLAFKHLQHTFFEQTLTTYPSCHDNIFCVLQKLSCKAVATRKAILRTLKLLIIGLFLQGHLQELQLLDYVL